MGRVPAAVRLYRRALAILPSEFRSDHGDAMAAMFEDEWRERRALGRVTLLMSSALDLLGTAWATRMGSGTGEGRMGWVNEVMSDVRVSVRSLSREPLFTATAVLSLALGVGGVAAVYAVADALLLRPIQSVRDPDRLVELVPSGFSFPLYQDFAAEIGGLDGLAAHRIRPVALETGAGGEAEPVEVGIVSGNFFRMLDVGAALGRSLAPDDDRPGAPAVAVLSHRRWTAMGRRPDVIGSTVRVNGTAFEVVGVAPAGFDGLRVGSRPALWMTVESWPRVSLGETPDVHSRGWWWIGAIGRLRPGVTLAMATAEAERAVRRITAVHPDDGPDLEGVHFVPMRTRAAEQVGAGLAPLLLAFGGVVLLALLAAASNVASLLLARATRRTRELGIRAALGADRIRLARLLAVECGVLVALGLAGGLGLSVLALRGLAAAPLPYGLELDLAGLRPDLRLLGLIGALLAVIAAVAGIGPALTAARIGPAGLGSTRGASAGRSSLRLRSVFVAVQIAVGVVLLAGTAMFGGSMVQALRVDLGFDPAPLGVLQVDGLLFKEDRPGASAALERLVEALRARPGVEAAAWSTLVPLTEGHDREGITIVGRPVVGRPPSVEVDGVGTDFFRTLGLRIVRGEVERARTGEPTGAVINEAMARKFWPDADPLGAHLQIDRRDVEVVAIAADARMHGFGEEPQPLLYDVRPGVPTFSLGRVSAAVVVRGAGAAAVVADAHRLVRSVDPRLVVNYASTGPDLVRFLVSPQRAGGVLLALFSLLALALALTGVYGVVAYGVGARLREFGVRLTLGARPERLTLHVLGRNLTPVLIGAVLGAAASAALARVAAAHLFGLRADDPTATAVAILVMLAAALAASWIPSRRAGRVDPATVLAAD